MAAAVDYVSMRRVVSLRTTEFIQNAAEDGAAIALGNRDPVVRNNLILQNNANNRGGAIMVDEDNAFVDGISAFVEDNLFLNNSSGGSGGGVWCDELYSTRFVGTLLCGNTSGSDGGALFCDGQSRMQIHSNLITGNRCSTQGGAIKMRFFLNASNNTIAYNRAGQEAGGIYLGGFWVEMRSCIFAGNNKGDIWEGASNADPRVNSYHTFWGNADGIYYDLDTETTYTTVSELQTNIPQATNNLDGDPLFVGDTYAESTWTAVSAYDPLTYQTTLTDTGASYTPDSLVGCFINPNTDIDNLQWYIVSNTANTITVWGEVDSVMEMGRPYRIFDYHLQNVADGYPQNSPCIDSGDPGADYSGEPYDNGGRINQGCYGNTSEAARTSGADPADVNRDGFINGLDLFSFSRFWQIQDATPGHSCNSDQDTDVDENDLLYFVPEWK